MRLKPSNTAVILGAVLLAACSTTDGRGSYPSREWEPLSPPVRLPALATPVTETAEVTPYAAASQTSYRTMVALISDNTTLQQAAQAVFNAQPNMMTTTRAGSGMVRLNLAVTAESQRQQAGPRLVGRLQRGMQQTDFQVDFVLTGPTGDALTQGRVTITGTPQPVVYPAPALPQQNLSAAQAQAAMTKILPLVRPHIQAQPWQAQVLSMIDPYHVALGLGPESGLKMGDILVTTSLPKARLQLVSFEPSGHGVTHAVLRLIVGQLPQAGKFVVPE